MKIYLDGVLVVEGKEDASFLSNYIESEIVVLNGFEMDPETISYLKDKRVIALLDPDESGKQIRNKINKKLTNVINVEIDVKKCTRGFKNGVAECEIDEIISALTPYFGKNEAIVSLLKESDLYKLGLVGDANKRNYICKKFNLGKCNGKLLYKRLKLNNINYEQLENALKDYK